MLFKKILLSLASSVITIAPQASLLSRNKQFFLMKENYNTKENKDIIESQANIFNKNLNYNNFNSISTQISNIKNAGSFWPIGDFRRNDIYGLYVNNYRITNPFEGQHIVKFSNNVMYDHWYTYTVATFEIKYVNYAYSPEDFLRRYKTFRASAHIMVNFWNEDDDWTYSGGSGRNGLTFTSKYFDMDYKVEYKEGGIPVINGAGGDLWKWKYGSVNNRLEDSRVKIYTNFNIDRGVYEIEMELGVKLGSYQNLRLSGGIIKVRYPQLLFN